MSLQLAGEEMKFEFNQFKKFPYEKKTEIREDRTIEELAAIYFSIPQNDLERSLTNNDSIPNDEARKELDEMTGS